MKAHRGLFLCAAAAAILAVVSCTPNGGSIYATIETAKKTVTSALAKTLTVQDLVNRSPGGGGPYEVAAGAIFEGTYAPLSPSTAGDLILWSANGGNLLPLTPPVPGQICNSLVLVGANLWGGFFNPNDSTFGLYMANVTSFAGAAPVSDPMIAGKQIMLLQSVNGYLFAVAGAVTSNPYVFELDYWNGTAWIQLLSNLPYMINGVTFDGLNYWAVGGTTVYTFTTNPPLATSYSSTSVLSGFDLSVSAVQLNGIFRDGSRLFIPTKNAGVFFSPNQGVSWIHYQADNVNNTTVGYLAVAGSVDNPAVPGAGDVYLVGADGYGYYYLSISLGTMTRFNDSTILLYSAAVRRILIDPANLSVFMGTAGGGLWRSTFYNGAPDNNGWIHE
jgi:hypothetical protein